MRFFVSSPRGHYRHVAELGNLSYLYMYKYIYMNERVGRKLNRCIILQYQVTVNLVELIVYSVEWIYNHDKNSDMYTFIINIT